MESSELSVSLFINALKTLSHICLLIEKFSINLSFSFLQDLQQDNDDPLKKLGQSSQKIVQCRICKGDHWTTKCPYKDQLEVIQAQVKDDEAKSAVDAGNELE